MSGQNQRKKKRKKVISSTAEKQKKQEKQEVKEEKVCKEIPVKFEIQFPSNNRVSKMTDREFDNWCKEFDSMIQQFDKWIEYENLRFTRSMEILDEVIKHRRY